MCVVSNSDMIGTHIHVVHGTTYMYEPAHFMILIRTGIYVIFHRVEGLSGVAEPVIITDVIYTTETKPLHKEGEGEEEKGEYERLKSVIEEKQKELKHLEFKTTVLERREAFGAVCWSCD